MSRSSFGSSTPKRHWRYTTRKSTSAWRKRRNGTGLSSSACGSSLTGSRSLPSSIIFSRPASAMSLIDYLRQTNMPMKNHPHPGRIVRQDFLEPLGLTVTEAANVLGVARQTINNLVNEKAGISAEMAVRLSKAFGPSPDMWVRLQANYDLSRVRQDEISVARYKRAS